MESWKLLVEHEYFFLNIHSTELSFFKQCVMTDANPIQCLKINMVSTNRTPLNWNLKYLEARLND
jgi:hypothetical protein